MPEVLSSMPAWDPSSCTPLQTVAPPPIASSSQSVMLAHPLFDLQLSDIDLKVIVNGGGQNNKEFTVSITSVGNKPIFQYMFHKQPRILEPAWEKHKHPSATQYNRYLIVIKGEIF